MTAIQTKGSGKAEYRQLSKARVTKNRNIVISECSKGGFTVAQQLVVSDDQNEVSVFMKGAMHIHDFTALVALRDALDEAIGAVVEEEEGNGPEDDVNWDE